MSRSNGTRDSENGGGREGRERDLHDRGSHVRGQTPGRQGARTLSRHGQGEISGPETRTRILSPSDPWYTSRTQKARRRLTSNTGPRTSLVLRDTGLGNRTDNYSSSEVQQVRLTLRAETADVLNILFTL